MNRRSLLAAGMAATALLPGCAPLTAVGEATGMLDASGAISLYGIVKGVAEVALIADPGLGLVVNAALAVAEPLLADVQSDSATAASSAAALTAQANQLLVATAGVVTVKPNAGAA